MGRREEKQAANRQRLLEAALVVFVRDGYHAASLAAVAAEAGLTKGAVYSNFASKRALLLAAMSLSSAPWAGFAPMAAPEPTLEAVLRAWGRAYAQRIQATEELRRHLALIHDFQALVARNVDELGVYGDVSHLALFLVARALERVAVHEGVDRGRSMTGVTRALMAQLLGVGLLRASDSSHTPELVAESLAALADLDDVEIGGVPAIGKVRAASDLLGTLPVLDDLVRGGSLEWAKPSQVVVLLPLRRARDIAPIVRGVRAADAEVDLVVVVTAGEGQEDIAAQTAWGVPDLMHLARATIPDELLPDLAVAIDVGGNAPGALGVRRDYDEALAFAIRDGVIVARGTGPAGARGVAAAQREARVVTRDIFGI